MTSDVPVKDLRPLEDWRDELGLDRLRADLINGELDAWWHDHTTGEWHQIERAHWQKKIGGRCAVKHASGWGWLLGGGPFSSGVRLCAIHAARPAKHAGGKPRTFDRESLEQELSNFVLKNGWPETQAVLERHVLDLGLWGELTWVKARVREFWQKRVPRPKTRRGKSH
jgi:hypothetical protein